MNATHELSAVALSYLTGMKDVSGPNRGRFAPGVKALVDGGYVRLRWLSRVEYALIKTDKGRATS